MTIGTDAAATQFQFFALRFLEFGMTDRVRTLTVLLDADYRDDDESVGVITRAIGMIKGVESVETGDAVNVNQSIAEMNYRHDVGTIIADIAMQQDREFINDVKAAQVKMKLRRGY